MKTLKHLDGLHPILALRAQTLGELCKTRGLSFVVTAGLRSNAEQDALYAKGRTTEGKVVTKARGGESWHNYGLAFDFVPIHPATNQPVWEDTRFEWQAIGDLGESLGLEWGGRWGFKDKPHFQLTAGIPLAQAKLLALPVLWDMVTHGLAKT